MVDAGLPVMPHRLVLYDGVCGFCDGAIRWLIARDPDRRLRFATLQGEIAAELRRRHPEIPSDLDTMVYVDGSSGDERVHLRSEAIFSVLSEIRGPWRWLAWLRVLPRWITDPAYGAFARIRYRVFGKLDRCALPTPDQRARFLV